MAPVVSLQDRIERLEAAFAGRARVALAGQLQLSQLGKPAAAAGLSAAEAGAWLRGETLLPPGQSVALIVAIDELSRARQQSYMESLKGGHAGSNLMQGSYQARVAEKVALSRGRTEDRIWLRGGPLEVTGDDVEETLGRLRKDFPSGWRFEADGELPKLVWLARHRDHGEVSGVTSLECAEKVEAIEERVAADADVQARYRDGRGVAGRKAG